MGIKPNTKLLSEYRRLLDRIRTVAPMFLRNHFDFFIAGGAIRDALFGHDVRDIDVFCVKKGPTFANRYDPPTSRFLQAWASMEHNLVDAGIIDEVHNCIHACEDTPAPVLEEQVNSLENLRPVNEYNDHDWDSMFSRACLTRENHVTLKLFDGLRNEKPDLQFITHPRLRSIEEVLSFFDLNICMVAYDGTDFYSGPDVSLSEIEATFNKEQPLELKNPWSSYRRLDYFSERFGFEVDDLKDQLKEERKTTFFVGIPSDGNNYQCEE